MEERHFALVDGLRVATWARFNLRGSRTQSDPAISSITYRDHDYLFKLPCFGERDAQSLVVAANMPLTDTEATKFWPVYDRYIAETIKVNDVRFALLKEYAKSFDTATEEQADSFIKRWLALDQDNTQLRLKYIPDFEKVISHKKTAMFFQIDRRVSMMVELQLASQVPLVKP
jgi:hypothetical protein